MPELARGLVAYLGLEQRTFASTALRSHFMCEKSEPTTTLPPRHVVLVFKRTN